MYLHEWYGQIKPCKKILDQIAESGGFSIRGEFSGRSIDSSVTVVHKKGEFLFSEFPGNCSALVVSSIQSFSQFSSTSNFFDEIIKVSIEMSEAMSYALLFASGTSDVMRSILIEKYGFEEVLGGIMNPHSGRENYFLVKRLKVEEIK